MHYTWYIYVYIIGKTSPPRSQTHLNVTFYVHSLQIYQLLWELSRSLFISHTHTVLQRFSFLKTEGRDRKRYFSVSYKLTYRSQFYSATKTNITKKKNYSWYRYTHTLHIIIYTSYNVFYRVKCNVYKRFKGFETDPFFD